MYLKDLDLDIPYRSKLATIDSIMREQECTYEQATLIDYEKKLEVEYKMKIYIRN